MKAWSVAMALAMTMGCGSSGARHDAAPVDMLGLPPDASPPGDDAATTDDGPAGDGLTVAPHGTQLLASSDNVWLRGVTDDGLAIYYDTLSGGISALPLAGGPAALITRLPGQFPPNVKITGSAVAIATGGTQATSALWTAAQGGHPLSNSGDANVAVSADGQYVLFFDGIGTTDASLFAARTDGTARTRLTYLRFPNPFDPNACPGFQMGFAGSYAVAAYCEPKPDGVPHRIQVATWTAPAWTKALQVPEDQDLLQQFATSPGATQVLVKAAGGLRVYPIEGGAPTTIDATGLFGAFTGDGKAVIYTTTAQQLRRADAAAPAPQTLLAAGAAELLILSPDDRFALVSSKAFDNSGTLRLASTTTPGEPLFQSAGPVRTPEVLFTADSKYAVYVMSQTLATGQVVSSCLYAVASNGAGVPTALTPAEAQPQWVRSASGARLIFEEAHDGADGPASFSIKTVDLSRSATPTALVTDVSEAFLTAANDQVVYRWHLRADRQAGIWVTPVP